MKNLKMFAIGLAAFAAMTMGVHAVSTTPCNKPGQSLPSVTTACQASVNDEGYASKVDAWAEVINNGGTIELYEDFEISAVNYNITKDVTVEAGEHTFTINNAHHITVNNGATLTINNGTFKVTQTSNAIPFIVDNGGTLVLNNVNSTLGGTFVTNNGTTTIKGGEITDTCINDPIFNNNGTLTVNGAKINATNAKTVISNSGVVTLEENTVNAPASKLVITAKHGSEATLVSGTYNVNRVLDDTLANTPNAANGEKAAKIVIKGGTYNTAGQAIEADGGIALTIEDGTFTATSGTAIKIFAADVVIKGGTFTANNGYVIDTKAATNENGTPNASLTISGGNFIAASNASKYVISIGRAKMTYAISGGTFESRGSDNYAAIKINLATPTTTQNGVTSIANAVKGILTGGKYLNNIVAAVVVNSKGATVDVSDQLVAEGYTVKVEDPYKLVVSTNPSTTEPRQDEPTVPSDEQQNNDPVVGDNANSQQPEENVQVAKTGDNIVTYMGLGLASLAVVALGSKNLKKQTN